MRHTTSLIIQIFLLIFIILITGRANAQAQQDFIRRKGSKLVTGANDSVVRLRGVCFGNQVWTDVRIPDTHHNEKDFKRVQEMGMNTIRFYMNYLTFEEDSAPFTYKKAGWDWLDKNIRWAKKHDIRLILNMHIPPGGFQSSGNGDALWNRKINQRRLINLWKVIASRYKNEPAIAGYDLLNEPHPMQSRQQWENLANRITRAIRSVDTNHVIIVEQTTAVDGDWSTNKNMNFFKVDDDNAMYTFHFYHPMRYTHQNAGWTPYGNDGKYPDKHVKEFDNNLEWYTATFDNPDFNKMSERWNYYDGKKYQVSDTSIAVGKPALVSNNNTGKVFFGDFAIKEFDPQGKFKRTIAEVTYENERHWKFWSKNGQGNMEITYTTDNYGNGYSKQIMIIKNTSSNANAYNNQLRFPVKQGHYYQISGWAKVERKSNKSLCQFRIDFEKTPFDPAIFQRNKSYLEHEFTKYLAFGKKHNVPMYLGEFGLHKSCLKNRKGGEKWVRDMVDLCQKHNVHFTYHNYHGSHMGLYNGYKNLPEAKDAREVLIEALEEGVAK